MIKKIDENTDKLKKEAEEWKNKYLRALADYHNLEKRFNDQKQEVLKYAAERLINDLLQALDTLEKADQHLKDPGLQLGVKSLKSVLENNGLKKIDVLGKKFDPKEMECIEVIGESGADEVIEELRTGYRLGDKILRVAQVKVGKKVN